jgi:hypothetical protein
MSRVPLIRGEGPAPPESPRRSRHLVRPAAFAAAILLAAANPAPANAQFGLDGGLSLGDLVGAGVERADTRQGLTGGGAWSLFSLGPIEVRPELHYVQKGADLVSLAGGTPGAIPEFGLDYVEVPLLARVGFGLPFGGDRLGIYGAGGPAFAWRINCSIRAAGDGSAGLSDDCALPGGGGLDDAVRSADQGLVLGGGLLLDVGELGGLSLNVRMIEGLARLSGDASNPEVRNRAVTFTLGWESVFH